MRERLEKILEEKINPILNEHMGGALLSGVEDGIAYIKFTGSCRGCFAAEDTLEDVVKPMLMEETEGLLDVRLDNSVSEELLDFARGILGQGGQR